MIEKSKLVSIFQDTVFREKTLFDQELSKYTSFQSGGTAWILQKISSTKELEHFLNRAKSHAFPYLILGKGSNTLFTDDGFHGVIVLLSGDFKKARLDGDTIEVGAGMHNRKVANLAADNGLEGAEFLATIPGLIGGSLFMNAGAYAMQMLDIVESVQCLNDEGALLNLDTNQLKYSYRKSLFMDQKYAITSCVLKLKKGNKQLIHERINAMIAKRKETQPINRLTWGSVFKNPDGYKAGALIEQCGLKGQGFGDVRLSQLHANFIENHGTASFDDIKKTILLAYNAVKKKFKVELELEVRVYDCYGNIFIMI